MPILYGAYGYTYREELILSTETPHALQDPTDVAVENLLATTVNLNDDNIDNEEMEDEDVDEELDVDVDVEVDEDVDEEFLDPQNLFVEETTILNRRMHEVLPLYDTFPEGCNADAESFPYSGMVELDNFDAERDQLRQGMFFKDKRELQFAVKAWSIRHNRHFVVRKGASNKTVWEVHCAMRDEMRCAWRLRGSMQQRKNGYWEIVRLGPNHTCLFSTIQTDHPNLNSCMISRAIAHLVTIDPSIRIGMIIAEIEKEYKITIAYNKAWYAKQKVIGEIYGDWRESYAKLPQLFLAIKQKNPGTHVHMYKSRPDPVTNECELIRLFWAFGPVIQGFYHCRPVMSIDATHLYGKYKGKLLIALGVDGNGQIYPVAYALVREETSADWGWFLRKLRAAIGPVPNLCLISDRHKSIISAVRDPLNGWAAPMATHRFCLRHIRSNFMTKWRNATLKQLVWNIGSSIEKYKFEEKMQELKELHEGAWKWCMDIRKEEWSLAYDGGHRYGCMTTNLVECFNGVLKDARNLPICAIVMLIFHRQATYFIDKRNNYNRMLHVNEHDITDRGVKLCEDSREYARHLRVVQLYNRPLGIASIMSTLNHLYPVDLSKGICGCGSWIQYKVPCGHAMRVCIVTHKDYRQYVHPLYKLEAYRLTYMPQFYPLEIQPYWPPHDGPTLIPLSGTLRTVGRPRSTRFRNEMDERGPVQHKHCSNCRQPGHTIRTCKSPAWSSMPPH